MSDGVDSERNEATRVRDLRRGMRSAVARVGSFRDAILRRRAAAGEQDEAWIALQEIDVAHEELRVAEEELEAQAAEIAVTRAALDAERRRYTELFENAPEAYVVTDSLGCVIEANRLAGALFNLDPVFFSGKPLASFVYSDDRAEFRDLITLMGAARVEKQLRITPRHGNLRWVSVAAQGTGVGARVAPTIRWIIRDIHAEKLASRQEPRRTAPSAPDALLGEVAQEMRTPLGAIAGWLQVISQVNHGETTSRALLSMTRSVLALAKLIEDVVEHRQLAERAVKLEYTTVNLPRLVIEVIEDLRPLALLKHIKLHFSAHPHRLELRADALRLQQLFRNLLGNALKFTAPGGSVHIDVAVAQHAAVVAVTDTGCGIPAEALQTIFEPFVQLEKQHGRENGPGLGLSVARRIAVLHGGTVEAVSDGVGRGATFRVTVPLTTFN